MDRFIRVKWQILDDWNKGHRFTASELEGTPVVIWSTSTLTASLLQVAVSFSLCLKTSREREPTPSQGSSFHLGRVSLIRKLFPVHLYIIDIRPSPWRLLSVYPEYILYRPSYLHITIPSYLHKYLHIYIHTLWSPSLDPKLHGDRNSIFPFCASSELGPVPRT